jgi:hypothetical protein
MVRLTSSPFPSGEGGVNFGKNIKEDIKFIWKRFISLIKKEDNVLTNLTEINFINFDLPLREGAYHQI